MDLFGIHTSYTRAHQAFCPCQSTQILHRESSDAIVTLAGSQEVLKALKGNIKCEKHEKESQSKGIYQLWTTKGYR